VIFEVWVFGSIMEYWNSGMMEYGLLKGICLFYVIVDTNSATTQHCSIPKPIFPLFQHSNIPIGAKPFGCFKE